MRKTARILYIMVGIIFPIFIGGLHTLAHFNDLITPEVQAALSGELMIMGEPQIYWNAWGVMSIMMGAAFITIGFLNLSIFTRLDKSDYPPLSALFSMVFYLFCVIYVGLTFEAGMQLYGGIFGLVLTVTAIVLSWNKKSAV